MAKQNNGGTMTEETPAVETAEKVAPAEGNQDAATHREALRIARVAALKAADRIAPSFTSGKTDSQVVRETRLRRTIYQALYLERIGELQGMKQTGSNVVEVHNAAVDYLAAHPEEVDSLADALKEDCRAVRILANHGDQLKGKAYPSEVVKVYSGFRSSKKELDGVTYQGIVGKIEDSEKK